MADALKKESVEETFENREFQEPIEFVETTLMETKQLENVGFFN